MTPFFLASQHEHHPFSRHTIRGGVEHGTCFGVNINNNTFKSSAQ